MKRAEVTPVQAFGTRLAQLRREKAFMEERDIGPIDVARAVGVGQSSVSRWEGGEVFPNDESLTALAAFYGVNRAWLRYGEGEKHLQNPIPLETESERDLTARPSAVRRAAGGRRGT